MAINKSFFRPVHFQAIFFLVIYNVISKWVFFKAITHESIIVNFLVPYVFGIIAGLTFLYLLNHEDFFHFMREVERVEAKKEKGLIERFLNHGKVLTTFLIMTIGGPIFGALTIRLLLPRYKNSFLILATGNIFSTILVVGLAKGLISFI